MFLLVSGRHVGTHSNGHQRSVPIQISISWVKIFSAYLPYLPYPISSIFTFFLFSDSGLLISVLISIVIYFEWLDSRPLSQRVNPFEGFAHSENYLYLQITFNEMRFISAKFNHLHSKRKRNIIGPKISPVHIYGRSRRLLLRISSAHAIHWSRACHVIFNGAHRVKNST